MNPIVACFSIAVHILFTGFAMQVKADTIDHYQIYLKNEIVIRESDYAAHLSTVKFLLLTADTVNDTIHIHYNHCTPRASDRKIVIWNGEDILFSRSFPDQDVAPIMKIPLKELTGLYNVPDNNNTMEMRYYDDQLPADGVRLAYMRADKQVTPPSAKQAASDQPLLEWAVAAIMTMVLLIMAFRKLTRKPA